MILYNIIIYTQDLSSFLNYFLKLSKINPEMKIKLIFIAEKGKKPEKNKGEEMRIFSSVSTDKGNPLYMVNRLTHPVNRSQGTHKNNYIRYISLT